MNVESILSLYKWSGDGADNEYKWTDSNKQVTCKYIKEDHMLQVKYTVDGEEIEEVEEKLRTQSKPNVFTMRKTSERLLNEKLE